MLSEQHSILATLAICARTLMLRMLCPQNDYKTLDPSFMESVWWVFKQLFEKGLVYRGFKVGMLAAAGVACNQHPCGVCLRLRKCMGVGMGWSFCPHAWVETDGAACAVTIYTFTSS